MMNMQKFMTIFHCRLGDNVFYRTFVTVVNFNDKETNVDINGDFHPILDQGLVVVASSNTYEVG